jgi:hypothetical protein
MSGVIGPRDIDELRESHSARDVVGWCEKNGVEVEAALRVAKTCGTNLTPGAIAVDAFRVGYEACKRREAIESKPGRERPDNEFSRELAAIEAEQG